MIAGRDGHTATVAEALSGAENGCPSAVLITGDPGMGKTSLLESIRDRLEGTTIFTCSPIEAEREIPFAGLHQLLLPAMGQLDRIPKVQANALRSALAVSTSQGEAPLAIGAAVLSVVAIVSLERPVVFLIDDAHWLDAQTKSALRFTTRRLTDERVTFVVTSEDTGSDWPTATSGLNFVHIELSGLTADDASELVRNNYPDADEAVISAVVNAAAGNPQVLLHSPSLLTDEQRKGTAPLPQPIPVTTGLPHSVLSKLNGLSDHGRSALLYASVAGTGAYRVVAACDESSVTGMAEVEAAGLVSLSEGTFQFTHRLTPSGVYRFATPDQRRNAHRRIAEALRGNDRYRERRAWHLAAAAAEPDDVLSQEIADAAKQTVSLRGHGAASSLFETAARLSEAPRERDDLLGKAAHSAWLAGEPSRAFDILRRLAEDNQRAHDTSLALSYQLDIQRGTLSGPAGEAAADLATAFARLGADATESDVWLLLTASRLADPPMALEYAQAALQSARDGAAELAANLAIARAEWVAGSFSDARRTHEAVGRASWRDLGIGDELLFEALMALSEPNPVYVAAPDAIRQLLDRARVTTTVALAVGHLATGHGYFARGNWSDALNEYLKAESVAIETQQEETLARARRSIQVVRVLRGGKSVSEIDDHRSGRVTCPVEVATALSLIEQLSRGRDDHVHAAMTDSQWTQKSWATVRRWVPPRCFSPVDFVEAATKISGREAGQDAIAVHKTSFTPLELKWAEAVVCVDDEAPLKDLLSNQFHNDDAPYERARALLLLGSRMRRAGQTGACRDSLREAMKLFAQLQAKEWMGRSKRELAATGIAVHAVSIADSEELTSQELQVAQVVAGGATYREAAAELFLSPKTIEFHLSKVYRKLGISSRRELAGRLRPAKDAE